MMKLIFSNWLNIVGSLITMTGLVGLLTKQLDLQSAIVLIGIGGSWVGITSKSANTGSTGPSQRADRIIDRAEADQKAADTVAGELKG